MKKLLILLFLLFIPYVCFAGWDIPSSSGFLKKNSDGNLQPRDSSSGIQSGDVANCPSSGNCIDGNLTVTDSIVIGSSNPMRVDTDGDGDADFIIGTIEPTTASDTCDAGTVYFADDYIYFCHTDDTWVRVAMATW